VDQPVSSWARQRWGERAGHVRAAVVNALHGAVADAQDAQKVSKSRLLFPFGVTQAARRYECIVDALAQMDGAQVVKPKGSPHELVLLEGNLLYPFRYAKKENVPVQRARISDRKISALIREMFERFGPEPSQPGLFEHGDDPDPDRQLVLTSVPEGTRLVLIAYASNDRAGVINAWWGEAELVDRDVRWLPGRYEQLPLAAANASGKGVTAPLTSVPGPRLTGAASGVAEASPRFDDGAMPAVPLAARAPIERENSDRFPPATEPAPEKPKADEQDR
jgi:hypothetical protein